MNMIKDKSEIKYRENMQNIFNALADMNLSKKNRATLASFIRAAYVNGTAANHAGDEGHYDDVYWLAQENMK